MNYYSGISYSVSLSKYLMAVILFLQTCFVNGQGCSDAGFCTINSFKPSADSVKESKYQIKSGINFGSADHEISVYGFYSEVNMQLNNKVSLDGKVTSLKQVGNGISGSYGLSDIYMNLAYKLNEKIKLTAGIKIPFSDGNETKDDLPLPMDYQSSLGTFDIIFGIGYGIKNFQLVAAIQQPLTQNKNAFFAESYPETSVFREFQSTNNYKRNGDALLRVSYPFSTGNKLLITPSLLPIYHLSNDKYTDATGVEKTIKGSQGLTLNGNIYFDYYLNSKSALQLNAGMPFIVRDARPDGLTRHFVINLEYRIRF